MADIRETGQYQIGYKRLLEEIEAFGLTEDELSNYLYLLLDSIQEKIEIEGRIPSYAYEIIANLPLLYTHGETKYLEVMCTFDPLPAHIEDMLIDGKAMMPKSASARMNLEDGEYSTVVSWEERSF